MPVKVIAFLAASALVSQSHLWVHVKDLPERLPATDRYLQPGSDVDGILDLDDPEPLTRLEPR